MIYWNCRRCGSENISVKLIGSKIGTYCRACNSWIQWINYRNIDYLYRTLQNKGLIPENASYKRIGKFKNAHLVRCSNCRCQLHHSGAPAPAGQFDLIDAKFCPQCGKEFLF